MTPLLDEDDEHTNDHYYNYKHTNENYQGDLGKDKTLYISTRTRASGLDVKWTGADRNSDFWAHIDGHRI